MIKVVFVKRSDRPDRQDNNKDFYLSQRGEKWQFKHQKPLPEALINQLYRFAEKMKEWLAANPGDPGEATGLSYYFEVLHFLKISELYDDHFEI